MTSNAERQDDELFSIAAIYTNEVKDLREQQAWKTWKPLELVITLLPNVSAPDAQNVTTKADLYVKCSEGYPDKAPFIDVLNAKGLSNSDVANLKAELQAITKERVGNEVLLELIEFTRNYLNDHKRPQYESFHAEMLHNQEQQQKKILEKREQEKEAQKQVEEKTRLAFEMERNRKLEELKNANRKSRFPENVRNDSVKTDFQRPRSLSESSCKEVCAGTVRTTLKFPGKKELSVFCGKCLNHNQRGCIVYYGMDMASGDPVIVIKWTLQWPVMPKAKTEEFEAIKKVQENYMKQLFSVEQEFKTLRHLKHDSIVSYLGMHYVQRKDRITVYILQEHITGCPLSLWSNGTMLNTQQLQVYASKILQAIHYLHENSVVHRNIRDTSIFICSDGQVKVSDYSLDKKMYDIYRSFTNDPEIDSYPPTIGRGGKKGDVYRLGVVLLSLTIGQLPKDAPLKVPQSLNPILKDFINKCLLHDEQERWSVDQLLLHQFVAFSLVPSLYPRADVPNMEKVEVEESEASVSIVNYPHCSRLVKEFEKLEDLGEGGFGLVLKVKNKLDSRVYALKKIPLTSCDKQLDRKIKREVKVLSRLNHENIVRYYNSWIEESIENDIKSDSSLEESFSTDVSSAVKWEMRDTKDEDYSSEDEDAEDYDNCLLKRDVGSLSFITFAHDAGGDGSGVDVGEECVISTESSTVSDHGDHVCPKPKIRRFMYIQMEFCEKSTLRTAINNGLHADVPLVWSFFREIVEGLLHIHQQNVIHRDLKPVNIFIDSKDHVKIGDFGLATDVPKSVLKSNMDYPASGEFQFNDSLLQSLDAAEDGSCTGNVGTALYVAPEIATTKTKLRYSEKVDIYSLGIIFFEMCYPPPVTTMERVNIIANLRKPEIVFPADIGEKLSPEMIAILNWLLQHDASKRPFAHDLIKSDYIPPARIQETELLNMLGNTVSNSQSKHYKYLINCLFNQDVSPELEFTYDIDLSKSILTRIKPTHLFFDVVDSLNKVLKRHGFVYYSVPTLMPKSKIYNENSVYVLDHGGGILNLPHDLRVPFARHIARKEITQLKRFTLEKVYREEKVFGFHPREQYEYAFDIVTPSLCSLMPDAEALAIVSEIISEFPSLESRGYWICLNHVSLLKAVLKYCEFSEAEESVIYASFDNQKNRNATKLQLQHLLLDQELPEKKVLKLMQYVDVSDSFDKVAGSLQPIMQTKGEIGTLAKKGFKDLKTIIGLAEAFGVKLPMHIRPCLIHELKIYTSVVFQVVCDLKVRKKKATLDIIAAGGRYDKLVSFLKFKTMNDCGKSHNQNAMGVSLAIEKIVVAESENSDHRIVDFIVYSDAEMKEKGSLLKRLWSLGFSASLIYDKHMSLNDVVDYCQNNGIPQLMILNESEQGIIKLRSFGKEKVNERRLCYSDLNENLLTKCLGNASKSSSDVPTMMKTECQRSYSFTGTSPMNVRFLSQDRTHMNRKREPNIRSHVMSVLQPSSHRSWEIVAVDLKLSIVGAISASCDISGSEESIRQTFSAISETHSKCKKYLLQVCDEVCDIKSKKNSAVILYSMPDNNFRIIL